MGGDGGQVIDRATMVKTKGWGLTKGSGNRFAASLGEMANYVQMVSEDRGLGTLELHRTKMSQCFLSQHDLKMPVVACRLGNLYNKEAMIGALLNKKMPSGLSHIKKLSDLKNCVIEWKENKEDGKLHMVCPIARDELDSGGTRSVVIWTTGVVVGVKALKALKSKECPVTGKPFDYDQDCMALAPKEEELKKLIERLPANRKDLKRKAPEGEAKAVKATGSASASASTDKDAPDTRTIHDKGGLYNTNYMTKLLFDSNKDAADAPKDKVHVDPRELKDFEDMEKQRISSFGKKVKTSKGEEMVKNSSSEVYKGLFTNDRANLSGPRDAFGKPIYNQGSRCR